MDKARAGTATNGHHMNETAIKTDPRTWWIGRFLALQDDLARCLRIGVDGAPDTQKRRETATGHLAARGCGFHTDVFGPEGAILAMQTTDAARSGERLVLRAWREDDRISWNLDLERPRARRDEEYVETDASRQLGPATAEAADNMADKLLHVMKSDHSNWMLCRNTSLLFQHPGEVERAAQHVLKATTVIQKWIRRGDKPSVQELAEKLAADAGLSLTFAPTDDGGLSQVRIMVEINDRHTLSIDHRATTEIKRSLGFRATTSRTAEHASFNIQRDKSAAEPRWRLNGDSGGRIVLAYLDYLDAKKETGTARDNLANALLAITAHPAVATEQTLRDAFDAEQAEIGRITLGSSAGTGRPPDHQTEDTATPSR